MKERSSIHRAANSSSAPPPRAAASRSACRCARFAQEQTGTQVNIWVVVKPDDSCVIRIARSEMGQGTRTASRSSSPKSSNATGRSRDRILTAGQTPRFQARLGRNGHRRQPRHPHLAGLRAPRRRGSAHDAAAGGGQRMERAVWRAGSRERRHLAQGFEAPDPLRQGGAAAAKLTPPDSKAIVLKDPRSWKVSWPAEMAAGHPPRSWTAVEIRDRPAAARHAECGRQAVPVFGARLGSFDGAAIARRPGVKGAVKVDDRTVAVVADTWWRAKTALDALPIVWDEGAGASQSSAKIAEHLRQGLTASDAYAGRNEGDALKAIEGAAKKLEAVYATPFLAHATMEPMNCTARISAERGEVWVPTQNAEASLAALSEVSGLPIEKCEAYRPDLGCGFGRRGGTQDFTRQAVGYRHAVPGRARQAGVEPRGGPARRTSTARSRSASSPRDSTRAATLPACTCACHGQSINAYLNPAAIVDGKDRRQLQACGPKPATRSSATRCRTC